MNIKRNKIPQKTRLFSSKNRNSSMKLLPVGNRPKTGISRKAENYLRKRNSPKKLKYKKSTSNIYIDFKEGLDFRSVGPKSRIQDKIFNSYWEIKSANPISIFNRNNLDEKENNIYNKKLMQEIMQLYKLPQINWRNKNPSNFLNHIGGNELNLSQAVSKYTTSPNSSITGFNQRTLLFNRNKNRPVTAMIRAGGTNIIKRPNTALHKKTARPRTSFSPNKRIIEQINRNNSPSLFFEDNTNTNNINKFIPNNIKSKLDNKIKKDYNYKDAFFNQISREEEEGNNFFSNEESYYIIKEKEQNKSQIKKYPNYESLIKKFHENQLQNYSIKIDPADTDLLDLFDRSQKTHVSTKGKDVNLDYCSTNQKIASFMDFSQHLKLEAILKISKDIYRNKRNVLEFQSKHNMQKPVYGALLINKCPHFRDSNSLFHGFMPFEEEGQNLICEYNRVNNKYDPLDYMPKFGYYYLLENSDNYFK